MFRRTRRNQIGVGVAIYVRESQVVNFERLLDIESENEGIWVRLHLKNSDHSIPFGCTDYSPNADLAAFISTLERSLQKLPCSEALILSGDFNAQHCDWHDLHTTDPCG